MEERIKTKIPKRIPLTLAPSKRITQLFSFNEIPYEGDEDYSTYERKIDNEIYYGVSYR